MARVRSPMSTFNATSVATRVQNVEGRERPRKTSAMPLMMYCATLATPNGRTATMTRSPTPQDTTEGPDSQRMRSTGGMLRSARRRSSQGLSSFVWSLASVISWDQISTNVKATLAVLHLWMPHRDQTLDCALERCIRSVYVEIQLSHCSRKPINSYGGLSHSFADVSRYSGR